MQARVVQEGWAWLGKHPRVHLHFTPTYGSWLNLVEVFFAIIERQALRRGDFASVEELVTAIRRFCEGWNERCQQLARDMPCNRACNHRQGTSVRAKSDRTRRQRV